MILILTLKLISNIFLRFLVTIATYTVKAKELEGVILRFREHHEDSIPSIHHAFNAVYGVDLYETNFLFIFEDVATNGLMELHKDEPERVLGYMVAHIKSESGATLRTETEKVDTLFGNMQLSYLD